jgi:hypothetical protein
MDLAGLSAQLSSSDANKPATRRQLFWVIDNVLPDSSMPPGSTITALDARVAVLETHPTPLTINVTNSTGTLMTMGRSDAGPLSPDFLFDNNWKLKTKSVIVADIGDTPDLAMRAVGPVGAAYNATPSNWPTATNIGNLYWQAYGTDGTFGPGVPQSRAAAISAQTAEVPTSTGRGARLIIATCPVGSIVAQSAMVIDHDGTVQLSRGAGQRLKADFDSGLPNRCLLVTSGTNAATQVGVAPSGTATTSELAVFNKVDGGNASYFRMRVDTTDAFIDSNHTGSGADKPLSLQFSGVTLFKINGTGVGLYGVAPVARAAAITAPTAPSATYVQAEAAAMKTAVDAIRVALTNIGITS